MAHQSQQDLMREALKDNWSAEAFVDKAEAQARKKLT